MAYRGLTWDHPRGKHALMAAARTARDWGLEITWEAQPLEGFESHPIDELAARYDLIVLDHPHLGEAIAADALQPLDDLFSLSALGDWESASVGPSFRSYRKDGRQWAVPLDAATQVAAYKPSLIAVAPEIWEEVEALSHRVPVALSLAGPHALLSFASICVALGDPLCFGHPRLVRDETARRALELMRRITERAPAATLTMNPIALLAHMHDGDELAYCPLVYGYVNYSDAQLRFANAPRISPQGPIGSTIGGTGLALTRRCEPSPELLAHIEWLMSEEAQLRFIPAQDGQPSRGSAWTDTAVNLTSAGFYAATLETIESSWVRPRGIGFIAFQGAASQIVRDVVTGRLSVDAGIESLRECAYQEA